MLDVLIVGGGPAGAAAAITCARAGLDAVILERHAEPADKPGETLHPGVEPLLERLGVADQVRAAGFLRHEGIDISWDAAPRFEAYGGDANGPWQGFQAWRATFDQILLAAAESSGALVWRGIRVHHVRRGDQFVGVQTDRGPMQARWIVDASGGTQWLGRQLRLPIERLSPKLICWYGYVRRQRGDRPTLRADAGGWTWKAEVRPGIYQWTRVAFDNQAPGAIEGDEIGKRRAADVTWRWFPRCADEGYFLVGDAAVVLDPASSHGVLRALMTGMHAAHLMVASRGNEDLRSTAYRQYRTWLAAWVRHDAAAMRRLYARLPCPPAWVRPALADTVTA
jgi:flavin-dependent dehydrogenase